MLGSVTQAVAQYARTTNAFASLEIVFTQVSVLEKGSCPDGTGGTCGWATCAVSRNSICKNSKCVCESGNLLSVWRCVHGEYARGVAAAIAGKH